MFRWIVASLFGLEPIRHPNPQGSTTSPSCLESELDQSLWPEGLQVRKERRSSEPAGWKHTNWSWQSNGNVSHPGSLHPKLGKAESCHCLGVLQCQGCERVVRPNTKVSEMKAQLEQGCPDADCRDILRRITCEALWQAVETFEKHPDVVLVAFGYKTLRLFHVYFFSFF